MNGFLLIDKPSASTSFDVVRSLRELFGVRRAGHCGTLDPLATGLLVLALGKATKLAQFVAGQQKSYEVEASLGRRSDTYDRDGVLSETLPTGHITAEMLTESLQEFQGVINQRPPAFSALKRDGRPLYKYARAGEAIEIPEREVTIHEIRLTVFESPLVKFAVTCSKGTYVRSLVHDLGEKLGCGAHVTELRRTAIGKISIAQALTIEEVLERVAAGRADTCVVGIADMLELPELVVDPGKAAGVSQGVEIRANDIVNPGPAINADQLVALRNGHGNLLAVARTLLGSADFASRGDVKAIEYVRVM
ncbi:MAG: tRNA pseudouridine(55) synthase TruB [bacterium]